MASIRDIRVARQKHQRGTAYHRDQHAYADKIYTIYYKISNYNSHLDLNQHEPVKIWMTNLEQKNFSTFIDENFVTNTLLDHYLLGNNIYRSTPKKFHLMQHIVLLA
jgi:hypothetical protein